MRLKIGYHTFEVVEMTPAYSEEHDCEGEIRYTDPGPEIRILGSCTRQPAGRGADPRASPRGVLRRRTGRAEDGRGADVRGS